MTILLLFIYYITLTHASCTDLAVWVPEKYDTIDMVANALNLRNYDKLEQLNSGLHPDSILVGKTYTVPLTTLNPPASWTEINTCTSLLKLNLKTTSTGISSGSKQTESPRSSVKPSEDKSSTQTENEQKLSTKNTKENIKTLVSTIKTSTLSKAPSQTQKVTDQASEPQETTTTLLSTAKMTTQTKAIPTSKLQSNSGTLVTKASTSKGTSGTSKPSSATTKRSSTASVVCNAYTTPITDQKSYNTDEKRLKKYAERFCGEVDERSLSKGQSVQYIYGKSTEMYVFTISWISGCDGKSQSITGTGNLCYNRMIQDWNSCNNGGLGGSTVDTCVEWKFNPAVLVI